MAKKIETTVTLTDDIDPKTKAVETVAFSVDGQSYEIDLGKKNATALRSDFEKWSAAARKVRKSAPTKRAPKGSSGRTITEASLIRSWAAENGVEVPSRGRIPLAVEQAYAAR